MGIAEIETSEQLNNGTNSGNRSKRRCHKLTFAWEKANNLGIGHGLWRCPSRCNRELFRVFDDSGLPTWPEPVFFAASVD